MCVQAGLTFALLLIEDTAVSMNQTKRTPSEGVQRGGFGTGSVQQLRLYFSVAEIRAVRAPEFFILYLGKTCGITTL